MSPRWGTEGGGTARATLRNGCGRRPSPHPPGYSPLIEAWATRSDAL